MSAPGFQCQACGKLASIPDPPCPHCQSMALLAPIGKRHSYLWLVAALPLLFTAWLFLGFPSISPPPASDKIALTSEVEASMRDVIVSSGYKCPVVTGIRQKDEIMGRRIFSVFCGAENWRVGQAGMHYRVEINAGRGMGGAVRPWD